MNNYETNTNATQPMPQSTGAMSNEDIISCLNGLIEICHDGEEGFRDAAEGVERSDLKTTFYEFSQQRSQFAGVLQGLVRSLGGDIEDGGTFSGAVHRGWLNLKAAVTGKDEQAVLNECERGEDYAKQAYSDALKKLLPANIEDVVRQQSQAVQAAHNRVKELRNSEGASSRSANTNY